MDRKKTYPIFVLLTLAALLLGACMPLAACRPADGQAIYTAAAQTIVAQMTLSAGETAVAQLTSIAGGQSGGQTGGQPGQEAPFQTAAAVQTQLAALATQNAQLSATPGAPAGSAPTGTAIQPLPTWTYTPAPTWTPIPPLPTWTRTPVPPTWAPPTAPPAPPSPCDWAQFIKDVTIPDGTLLSPGAHFTKTWRLRNIGSCTWNLNYALVYVSGDRMQTQNAFGMPGYVRPGETIDITAEFIAPLAAGRYRANWMLANHYGQTFGIGSDARTAFWLDITVQGGGGPVDGSYAFTANMCSALWSNDDRTLPCPGNQDSSQGSVVLLSAPVLETGKHENEAAIWTRPQQVNGGTIYGEFPAIKIQPGDRFMSDIGCLEDSKACDVTFYVDYQVEGRGVKNLGSWREVYDKMINRIDVDLSFLAGERVRFTLRVVTNGKPSAADAFWLGPVIRRASSGDDGDPDLAVQASIQKLAAGLGIPKREVSVVSVNSAQWPDTCLGFYVPGRVCAPMIVYGYRVILKAGGERYEAHASEDGQIVYWVAI
ncbi:MAG: NBR1-Ig-like domain-containing protein [Chloroflexota bacterium]